MYYVVAAIDHSLLYSFLVGTYLVSGVEHSVFMAQTVDVMSDMYFGFDTSIKTNPSLTNEDLC